MSESQIKLIFKISSMVFFMIGLLLVLWAILISPAAATVGSLGSIAFFIADGLADVLKQLPEILKEEAKGE